MKLSLLKREKIFEQILAHLYFINPRPEFTSHIAREIARDEEFVKLLLFELTKKGLVVEVGKNKVGKTYKKRRRWILSERAYHAYKTSQNTPIKTPINLSIK